VKFGELNRTKFLIPEKISQSLTGLSQIIYEKATHNTVVYTGETS